jgi:hypothetical protein
MKTFGIYYANEDFACETGDMCLGTVEALSKDEAERIAIARGLGGVAGVRAVERKKSNPPATATDAQGEEVGQAI